ncbi:MAG: glutathione S-transferase family protein [Xanthobacteraceae bacterium]
MITLYHHGSSVCAAKVRLVLAEKSVPWDGIYVDILRGDQFDPGYVKLNPKAVVPTLVHDGKVIVESSVICEYLDEVFPAPSLKPAAPEQRAAMRLWTKAVDVICIRLAPSSRSLPVIATSSDGCRRRSSMNSSKARRRFR